MQNAQLILRPVMERVRCAFFNSSLLNKTTSKLILDLLVVFIFWKYASGCSVIIFVC